MDCGCGRSPNGKCLGWHDLSEEEYLEKLKEYEKNQKAEGQFLQRISLQKAYSTVTDFARFLGLSTSVPFLNAT